MEARVAVIILNWNGERLLGEFLPSVVESVRGLPGVRLVVADNGSSDGSLALLAARFPGVEVMPLGANHGFAGGYNRAVRDIDRAEAFTQAFGGGAGSTELCVLLNSDVRCEPGWLEPLTAFMAARPDVAACQPKILSHRESGMFEYAGAAGGFLDRHGYPYCRGRLFGTVEPDRGQYDDDCAVDWASGACLMVRRSDYLAVGGLDPSFFAHMEEIDLCWRLRRAGRGVWAVGSSAVYHLGGGSLAQGDPRKAYLNFRNNLLMLRKNLPVRGRRRALVVRRLLDTLAGLKCLLALDLAGACAILRAHADYRRMAPAVDDLRPALGDAPPTDRPDILVDYYLRRRLTYSRLR